MPTGRRPRPSSSLYQRSARRPAAPSGVNTMKVAGVLFCISAAVSAALSLALPGGGESSERTTALGGAFFVLLLGAGLIQGVGAVRVFVLAGAALASVAVIAMAVLLHTVREIQLLALAALLTTVGYFALLLKKEASTARVVASVALIVVGLATTATARLWLTGFERRAFGEELRKVASDEREYSDPTAGLSITVPPEWLILRADAEMYRGVPSKVTLGNPEAGAVAFINQERKPPGILTLDHYLDAVLARLNETGLNARQSERSDVVVGQAPARRMELTWEEEGRTVSGFISVWLDGDSTFTFIGATVGRWSGTAERRFAALEEALRFTAPVETALTEAQARLTQECPIFTAAALRTVARRISPDSPAETYFRVGWAYAIRGQGQLDPTSSAELGRLMGAAFAAMTQADQGRLAAYNEKIHLGERTSRAQDVAAMQILGRAVATLPPDSLGRLQALTDAALTVGALM